MKKVLENLKKILVNDSTVIIACSGGADSMCLLNILNNLKKEFSLKIVCAHVNHSLREESENEKIFVEKYCNKNDIIFEYKKLIWNDEKFSEQKGHKLRYNFYNELANKYNSQFVFTAHHGDDLIETILMRIIRGSNLNGYKGFSFNNDIFYKPLIYVTKDDILKYNLDNKVKFMDDKTNYSDKYTRNRIRKYILPILKKEDEKVHNKFISYEEELNKCDIFINKYINNLECIKSDHILIDKVINEELLVKEKAVEKLIKNIQKVDVLDVDNETRNNIIKLFSSSNKKINLANNYVAYKEYNKLFIKKYNYNEEEFNYVLVDKLETDKWIIQKIVDNNEVSNNIIRLNSKEIVFPLIIRNKIDKDFMCVKNLNGRKKISDIFVNEKISAGKRKEIPLLVDSNNNILWVAGVKKSKFDKKNNESYDIIIKYEKKEA